MSTLITGTATEPVNELTAPTPGGDTDTWGGILNEQTFPVLLGYILWLHENIGESVDASNVEYDNQTSELAAEDVQAALDELAVASVPSGGTTGQVLAKASDSDHDTEWVAQTGGGGGGIAPADGLVIVVHGDDDNVARPTAGVVLWRGSADPSNATAGDMWDDSEDWDS